MMPTSTAARTSHEKEMTKENSGPPSLGVLFVHGLGDEKRGHTLLWAGEPLAQWLQRWLDEFEAEVASSKSRTTLSDTYEAIIDPHHPDAPPHAYLSFRQHDELLQRDPQWILAESWWAPTFVSASFSDLVAWGLSIGPFMLQRIVNLPIDRLSNVESQNGTYATSWLPRLIAWLASLVILLVAQILFPLYVVGLLVLALVPPLSNLASSAQFALAGWIGEAYVMATSPLRLAAMTTQVQRDIEWLCTQGCRRVAVIAHSGGGPVAYDALSDPRFKLNAERTLLLTYGSAKRKQDIMRHLIADRSFFFALSPLMRVLFLGCLLPSLPLLFVGDPLKWVGLGLLSTAIILFSILVLQGWHFNRILDGLTTTKNEAVAPAWSAESRFDDELPASVDWQDFGAVADLVSEEYPREQAIRPSRSYTVNNLDSLLQDHGAYWANYEEFVPHVARLLHELAPSRGEYSPGPGWQWGKHDDDILTQAKTRRGSRVRIYFESGLLSILLWLTICVGLWPNMKVFSGPLVGLLAHLLPGLPQSWADGAASVPFLTASAGILLLGAGVAIWHQLLLFPAWRWWSRQETTAMYRHVRLIPAADADEREQAQRPFMVRKVKTGIRLYSSSVVILPIAVTLGLLYIRGLLSVGDAAKLLTDPWADTTLLLCLIALAWSASIVLQVSRTGQGLHAESKSPRGPSL